MKDLRILYSDNSGKRIVTEYESITDFTDSFESGQMSVGHDVFAEFFENPLPCAFLQVSLSKPVSFAAHPGVCTKGVPTSRYGH